MARLNIEEEIFKLPAFQDLIEHYKGDVAKALGEIVLFWFVAQRHWTKGEVIPLREFKKKWNVFLEVGLAFERDGGIYAKGAEDQFTWLRERIEAARKGGLARVNSAVRDSNGRLAKHQPNTSQTLDKVEATAIDARHDNSPGKHQPNAGFSPGKHQPKPAAASPLTLNTKERSIVSKTYNTCAKPAKTKLKDSAPGGAEGSTLLDAESRSVEVELVKNTERGTPAYAVEASPSGSATGSAELTLPVKTGRGDGHKVQAFIAKYCEAFRLRYGTRPVLDGAARGAAQSIVRALSVQQSFDAAESYLQMEDPKYVRKCHDLTSMRMDLNRIVVALDQGVEDPGKDVSRRKAERELDRRLDAAEAEEAKRRRDGEEQLAQLEREERERYGQGKF